MPRQQRPNLPTHFLFSLTGRVFDGAKEDFLTLYDVRNTVIYTLNLKIILIEALISGTHNLKYTTLNKI